MIQRTEVINVELTPREIELEIWNMDSGQQADLLLAMSQRYKSDEYHFLMQLLYIKDDFNSLLSTKEKENVIKMFEDILEYIKGEEG